MGRNEWGRWLPASLVPMGDLKQRLEGLWSLVRVFSSHPLPLIEQHCRLRTIRPPRGLGTGVVHRVEVPVPGCCPVRPLSFWFDTCGQGT